MPTYQYACTDPECGNRFELVQTFTDPAASECPVCQHAVRKVYGSVGVVFKGSGFYRNDSRAASSTSESPASSGEGSKSDSKSEAGAKTEGSAGSGAKTTDSGSTSGSAAGSTSDAGGKSAPSGKSDSASGTKTSSPSSAAAS